MIEHWKKLSDLIMPSSLKMWLIYKNSFMERLLQFGVSDAKITVLNESWQKPWDYESELLVLANNEKALVREVMISSKEKRWMFARTVFPSVILQGKYSCLANLKNRSLGSVLFKDPDLQRGEFEFILLQPYMQLYSKVINAAPHINETLLWTRRSVFTLHNNSLLLTEVFLPDMATL